MSDSHLNRRGFFALSAGLAAAGCTGRGSQPAEQGRQPSDKEFRFAETGIAELGDGLRRGDYTCADITAAYLERIERVEEDFGLGAVIQVNPEAMAIAEQLDAELAAGQDRGPLHGLPNIIKDNIATADRMPTTAGSLALEGSIAPVDSRVAAGLRAAGAVIIAKANLSEWANYRGWRSTSGWSGLGGQCANPYALDRNPSGSSSGSAAAASANLCAAAVGTETNGSIMGPSSVCGIVGLKPTVGLVGRSHIVPISHTWDTAGPMARTVSDAAALLTAIAGHDADDPATDSGRGQFGKDYTQYLRPDGLRGKRVGIARRYFNVSYLANPVFEDSVAALKDTGAEVVDPVDIPDHSMWQYSSVVMRREFKHGINEYLKWLGPDAPVKSLADIIEFNKAHADVELAFFGQQIFEEAVDAGPLTDQKYKDALKECLRLSRDEGIDKVMDEYELDAIFCPTFGPAGPTDPINGDHVPGGSAGLAATAGYPNITVPFGDVYGLPLGVSFWGRAWSEPDLIAMAFAFEQAAGGRKPPRLLPTIELPQIPPKKA